MATYNPIGNTEVDAESPITASLMSRLRDNPLAIQEGANGAPRIVTAALADGAVSSAKLNANTKIFTGTGDNGSFLINNAMRINFYRVLNVGVAETAITWQTPFAVGIWFCIAANNWNGTTFDAALSIDVVSHSLTGANVRLGGGGITPANGYVIAFGY